MSLIELPTIWTPGRARRRERLRRELSRYARRNRRGFIFTPGGGCAGENCHCSPAPSIDDCGACLDGYAPSYVELELSGVYWQGAYGCSSAGCNDLNTTFVLPYIGSTNGGDSCHYQLDFVDTCVDPGNGKKASLRCTFATDGASTWVIDVNVLRDNTVPPTIGLRHGGWLKDMGADFDCLNLDAEDIPWSGPEETLFPCRFNLATCLVTSGPP